MANKKVTGLTPPESEQQIRMQFSGSRLTTYESPESGFFRSFFVIIQLMINKILPLCKANLDAVTRTVVCW